jgi:hypothetical protein
MSASLDLSSSRTFANQPAPDRASEDAMVRFSISPASSGGWLWQTFDHAGQRRAHGLAATRKLAAALVIRDILQTRAGEILPHAPQLSAKAA